MSDRDLTETPLERYQRLQAEATAALDEAMRDVTENRLDPQDPYSEAWLPNDWYLNPDNTPAALVDMIRASEKNFRQTGRPIVIHRHGQYFETGGAPKSPPVIGLYREECGLLDCFAIGLPEPETTVPG